MKKPKKYDYFESRLQEIFLEEEPQTLDDDIPDSFYAWLETKEVDDIIEYAERIFEKLKD